MHSIQKYIDIVILSILGLLVLPSFITDSFSYNSGSKFTFITVGSLIVLAVLRILKIKQYKLIFTLYLLLGIFNLFRLSYFSGLFYFSFSANKEELMNIPFNIIYFYSLAAFLGVHVPILIPKYNNYKNKLDKKMADEADLTANHYIDKYYEELKKKEDSYLQNILVTKERWQQEYIVAAEKILNERKNWVNGEK